MLEYKSDFAHTFECEHCHTLHNIDVKTISPCEMSQVYECDRCGCNTHVSKRDGQITTRFDSFSAIYAKINPVKLETTPVRFDDSDVSDDWEKYFDDNLKSSSPVGWIQQLDEMFANPIIVPQPIDLNAWAKDIAESIFEQHNRMRENEIHTAHGFTRFISPGDSKKITP